MDFRRPPIYSWVSPKEFQVRLFKLSRCLIYKVQNLFAAPGFTPARPLPSAASLHRSAYLVYRILFGLSRTFLTFSEVFQPSESVLQFFSNFSAVLSSNRATYSVYHIQPSLSTTFFKFFASALSAGFLCRRSLEAAYIEYHSFPPLSTAFFIIFQNLSTSC